LLHRREGKTIICTATSPGHSGRHSTTLSSAVSSPLHPSRIINEGRAIDRVTRGIASRPPMTIEADNVL
jgi:GMP synthase PP-ATPase subunit